MKISAYFPLFLLLLLPAAQEALAFSPPNLSNLGSDQVDAVFKDFGANFVFRPLEPASTYGKYMGFSIGVIGGLTSSSAITSEISGTSALKYVPDADIFLGMQAPLGIAIEFGFFPNITVGGFKIHSFGGDLKWTINGIEKAKHVLPIDVAFRAMYVSSGLSYGQSISGVSDTITYSSSTYGMNLSASRKFSILEPYIGLGYLHNSSTLSDTGAITLFNTSVSLTDSFSNTDSSVWFYAGLQMTLLIPVVSLEYDNMFGVSAGAVKVGFKF